ncbi:hypothetical protein BGW36DRAFT_321293 [Talaromyces proteolyticus]|uniref:AAA+ ATPase domain-containing protein n=1 Tax=Talaromyces proteolyticus TaxID=1131652 RepID=A0AAD4PXC7_9EURO|nr:uncharacterized protein BGW36DRAFT_321293 [Talaromyces proteolyticus]KAH8696259.1 hypothetical protein BGW36DRAFT_321293 [Talaromyces proteolyticus]
MRPKSRNDFAVAIICALPLEADAVEAVFDETYDRLGKYYSKQEGDANSYINGRIGGHNVVLCYMPGMGKGSAASVASSLRVSYAGIRLALVVGICGGAPSPSANHEIFLGDVVISDSVIEYDFGRKYPGGFQRKTGVKDMLGRPDREIRTLLNGLRAEKTCSELENRILEYLHMIQRAGKQWCHPQLNDVLFKACYLHKHYERASPIRCCCSESELPHNICEDALRDNCDDLGCDKNQVIRCRKALEAVKVSAHIGTVASADTVMKSGQQRDAIIREENVIGFEMEGAGVWDNVPCIIVKGVCDYADSHKAKAWQAYAAATGACGAKAFLEYWTPSQKEGHEKRHLMIPFPKNPRFVGRQHEIHRLEELMSRGSRKLAITGLGGVGKTQVALELAYRMKEKDAECSIFWIPCTSYEAVEQACMTIAQMVGIQDVKPAEVKESIKAYFTQKHGKWLLVFDNADDMDMWTKGSSTVPALKDFLPYNDQGHIIFTSRNRKLAVKLASADVVHVPELDKETGLEFLEKSLIQQILITNADTRIALLEQLTFLPLAITQAAAYINENGIGVSDYLLLLEEQEADIVELLSEDFGDDGRYKDVQNPVAMTWLISFSQIQKTDQLAADYLSLMACVNPRNIPQSLFPQPISKKRMVDALGVLNAYSFIDIQPGNGFLTLHRLVHLATRNWIRKEQQFSICIIKAADRFKEVFPDDDPTNRQLWREYLPHALFLLGESEFKVQQEQYINFLWKVGRCLDSDGRYNEAEMLFKDVVMLRQQGYGDTHVYTLASIADLASTYWNQGRWKEAEELEIQVMETRKQVQGPEHPDTLTSIANLASTYRNQGQWKKAEKLEMQVIETRKQVLEPEHPKILNSMENLASTYWNQGRWKEAEELDVQVMKIRKQRLGPEHPNTLTSMANLASIYGNQGRWKEAEELEVQVMETRKQILGPEHPNTLISMANLASTYWNQGRWKEAEELQTTELKLCSKTLGPEHPDTLTSIANLALIYGNQGRWKEAEELEVQMMETRKQILGPEHPNTLTSIANLASTYWNQGRLKEAEELEIQVIKTRKQVLGPEHPSTLTSMANLASTYGNQGRWKEAEELEVQVMETRKQILGPEHPNTLISMANLASTYWNQGRWKEAEELEIQVMETRKQVLGPEHPDTLTSMANLAYTLESQGKLADAIVLMQNCYELRNKVLGPDHPDARSSSDDLKKWED